MKIEKVGCGADLKSFSEAHSRVLRQFSSGRTIAEYAKEIWRAEAHFISEGNPS